MKNKKKENMLSFVWIFRNKLNAMFGDDPQINIYEVDEPLPDGTIEYRDGEHTLNIVCSDVAKLVIMRDHIGDRFEDGEVLNIDYYYGKTNGSFLNIENVPKFNSLQGTPLDIKILFEGNPHFSKLYTGWGQMGPWFCVAFKPEVIQYHNDDAVSLNGRKTTVMEDIARELFTKEDDRAILFSTENVKDYSALNKLVNSDNIGTIASSNNIELTL